MSRLSDQRQMTAINILRVLDLMKGSAYETDQLEQGVLRLLEDGIIVSDDTLFFAASTWGLGPGDLEPVLKDSQFEEREALQALILTPSTAMREVLEPLLAKLSLAAPDTHSLAGTVHGQLEALTIQVEGEPRISVK